MKVCPHCNAQYADDTLSFCLDDGTPLVHGMQADTPTVVLGETETYVARGPFVPQPSEVTRVQTFDPSPPQKGANTGLTVALTALGMLLLFVVAGIAALLYMRSSPPPAANVDTNISLPPPTPNTNLNAATPVTNSNTTSSPIPTVSLPQTNTNVNSNISDGPANTEIPQRVYAWKSNMEARDLDAFMDNYASTLERYYTRSGMSRSEVRSDKARAFNRFSSMRVTVSNMVVTSDGPSSATATFDKEWTFSGGGSSNNGKVRSQLKFQEIGGRWLIVSERDVRVYYTR
ncbi:MAG: hypothetical protein IPM59_07005 [Chloracidobacterium sp.]|nr:hypothetical protein [Chloracidobacterium sp.]